MKYKRYHMTDTFLKSNKIKAKQSEAWYDHSMSTMEIKCGHCILLESLSLMVLEIYEGPKFLHFAYLEAIFNTWKSK
jgi:hypothetical protein